jgi:hypothetical protein
MAGIKDDIIKIKGIALKGADDGDDAMAWSGTLPQTGRYLIVVGGTRGNASYRLEIAITTAGGFYQVENMIATAAAIVPVHSQPIA